MRIDFEYKHNLVVKLPSLLVKINGSHIFSIYFTSRNEYEKFYSFKFADIITEGQMVTRSIIGSQQIRASFDTKNEDLIRQTIIDYLCIAVSSFIKIEDVIQTLDNLIEQKEPKSLDIDIFIEVCKDEIIDNERCLRIDQ